jgi:hypothetical protein
MYIDRRIAVLVFVAVAGSAGAAARPILGKKLPVRDPTGSESRRRTVVVARETATDVPAVVGVLRAPTYGGALQRA